MKPKLRIIIIGYYGKLNAGDDLLQNSLCQLLQEHDLLFTSWFPGTDFLNTADLVIVGGGSIWPGNPFFQHGKAIARHLKAPLIILGISAKREDQKIRNETRYLIDIALFFHVRDHESKTFIGNDNIIVGPDLYWWGQHELPKPKTSQTIKSVCLNLRIWNEIDWDAEAIYNTVKHSSTTINPFPLYYGSAIHEASAESNDAQLLADLGCQNIPRSFNTKALSDSQYSIAMRFHALLMSIRAGIPVIGFDYHKKTRSIFIENDLEELCVPLQEPERLKEAMSLLEKNYQEYQAKTEKIRTHYLEHANKNRAQLMDIIGQLEPRRSNGLISKTKKIIKRYLR